MMLRKSYPLWKVLLAATNQSPLLEEVARMVTLKGSLTKHYSSRLSSAGLKTQRAQREYIFSFLVRGQKRSYSVMAVMIVAARIRTRL